MTNSLKFAVAVAVASMALVACGGRSAACAKAVSCGSAISSIGGTTVEASVKACEQVSGATSETCCTALVTSYTAASGLLDGGTPSACK